MIDSRNKSILLSHADGTGTAYSPEELMTLRINSWPGWRCSAGYDNIHVRPDGNIFPATCDFAANYGNAYSGPLNFAKTWLTCNVKWCMCGSDMRLRKAKTEALQRELEQRATDAPPKITGPLRSHDDAQFVSSIHFQETQRFPKSVTWDISKRCNFKCTYCNPRISNQTDRLRTREEVFSAAFKIMRGFAPSQRISWIFTGGEPTLHPFYLELCEMLFGKQHVVHTQTNGSRLPAYYAELIRWSCVGISVHLEFASSSKIADVTRAIIKMKTSDPQASRHWFGVRIMVAPGMYETAHDLYKTLMDIPDIGPHGTVYMSALYDKDEYDQMMTYDPDEFRAILALS